MLSAKVVGIAANGLALISSSLSAKVSHALWARTQRHQRPERELACLNQANQINLDVEGEQVVVYTWGKGNGQWILLVHGWSGRATQFTQYIDALLVQGYRVVAFDAPGHGESSGNQTNVLQVSRIVQSLAREYGPFRTMIGHSFGFVVVTNALSAGVKSCAVIGIGSPADFNLLRLAFSQLIGLNDRAELALVAFMNKRYALNGLDELSIHILAKKLRLPCLIVHDKNDKKVPISEAQKIVAAWQGAEQWVTQGLGHTRILRDQHVINRSIEFIENNNSC